MGHFIHSPEPPTDCTAAWPSRYAGTAVEVEWLVQQLLVAAPEVVGVNITGDAAKLKADFGFQVRGCLELGDLANTRVLMHRRLVTTDKSMRRWSLAGLVEAVLQRTLPKPNDIRCGDWERRPLTQPQIRYASLDAYAATATKALPRVSTKVVAVGRLAVYQQLLTLPLREEVSALDQGSTENTEG
ncbi:3'-5' exonuclease domain-containing protein, partial [Haematococcus lacustris]